METCKIDDIHTSFRFPDIGALTKSSTVEALSLLAFGRNPSACNKHHQKLTAKGEESPLFSKNLTKNK